MLAKGSAGGGGGGAKDPSATLNIPLGLTGAALSVRSDGGYAAAGAPVYGDDASVYADKVCSVTGTVISTTAFYPDPSGDAIIQMTYPTKRGCGRTVTVEYPDGGRDVLAAAFNVNKLHKENDPSTWISQGETSERRLILSFTVRALSNPNVGRCGRIIFGDNGVVGAGTDKLAVTRIDARTWRLKSKPGGENRALCENGKAIYNLDVDFVVVSSADLSM